MLVGGDDWALEGFCAGATGWVTGVADCAPAECVELYEACRAAELERARAIYARLLPLARLDMTPKLVQYFKGAQDALGFTGGPVRAPRLALDEADRAMLDAARRRAAGAGRRLSDARGALDRGGRLAHRGDADARGRRRRRADPGRDDARAQATTSRREMDDLRLLLMREPRGHGAMSGAILQPPTRADADWGVLFIEVVRLPADVRARDDRRRHRARRDRDGRRCASPRPSCGSTRPPGSSRRAWRSRTAARDR